MNLTITNYMTNGEIITMCHKATAIPAMIYLSIAFIIFFLFWGLILVKHSRGKIALILFLTVLFTSIVFLLLYLSPNFIQTLTDVIKNLFNK